jgi:hypothetical protein
MAAVTKGQESLMKFGLEHADQIAPFLPPPYNVALMAAGEVQQAGKTAGVDPLKMALSQYEQQKNTSEKPQSGSQDNSNEKKFNPRPWWAGPDKKK